MLTTPEHGGAGGTPGDVPGPKGPRRFRFPISSGHWRPSSITSGSWRGEGEGFWAGEGGVFVGEFLPVSGVNVGEVLLVSDVNVGEVFVVAVVVVVFWGVLFVCFLVNFSGRRRLCAFFVLFCFLLSSQWRFCGWIFCVFFLPRSLAFSWTSADIAFSWVI